MAKNILIIDDVKEQAEGLARGLRKEMPNYQFESYFTEESILEAIEQRFYSLAIVDIRMDTFSIDGIEVVKKIFEVNPFAKVIIVSAFKDEYILQLKDVLLTGKVVDIQDKERLSDWLPKLKLTIEGYFEAISEDPSEINKALLQYYSNAKNESDTYKKGETLEHFVSLLFQSIGFEHIMKRVIDKSLNEVDLIIRNDIGDSFLQKFGKYILIECKNKPKDGVDKNDFIVFNTKLKNTNGLSELGILITSGYIKRSTYLEALRDSSETGKIIFISNPQIERLINSHDKLSEFKRIIDEQVKDN